MKKVQLVIRILLGLMLILFGANKFLMFMPQPEMAPEMGKFMMALMETGYLMELVGAIEVIAGIMIIVNKYLALALVLIFPVMLNAFLAHLFLDPSVGMMGSVIVTAMIVYLMFANKEKYTSMLQA